MYALDAQERVYEERAIDGNVLNFTVHSLLSMSDRKLGFLSALVSLCGFLWLPFGTFFHGLPIVVAVLFVFALLAPGILLPFNRICNNGHFIRIAPISAGAYFSVDISVDLDLVKSLIAEDPLWGKY